MTECDRWFFLTQCCTPFLPTPALGLGSARRGGAPSTADGHFIALGSTEENLRKITVGLAQIGTPDQPPFDRTTGTGFVAAHDGHYSDALTRKPPHPTHLLVTECTGALSPSLILLLHILARTATAKGAQDATVYGESRASPHAFYAHHAAAISAAVQLQDAETLQNAAASLVFAVSMGLA